MPSGETTATTFNSQMPTVYAEARRIREQKSGTWERTTTVKRQTEGSGFDFNWLTLNQIDAQGISGNQNNENYQQFTAAVQSATPTMTRY